MTRILGVDFSGASDAGRKIWVADGERNGNGALVLEGCVAAVDLPGGGIGPGLAVPALARHIASLGRARVGCDFPFSLPRDLVTARTWKSFALRYAAEFADAHSFRAIMRSRHDAVEHRRMTDVTAKTPFNSYNLRLFRQTWWGISGVIGPLLRAGQAIVRPQQRLVEGKPILIEVCAACTLKSIDLYPSYKGKRPERRRARERILDHFIDSGILAAPARGLRRVILDNVGGDALDAVIGAVATAHADLTRDADSYQRLEGRVYFEIGV